MILGIGTDLTDARRIEASATRFGQKFLDRLFTQAEQTYAQRNATPHQTYAKRYAAKEAVMKALGTGLRGFNITDIEISNDALGKPQVVLSGGAQDRLQVMLPAGYTPHIHLSLTDEGPYAGAYVIIEALPLP